MNHSKTHLAWILAALIPLPAAQAATIVVTTTADLISDDGQCSLREAISAANTDGSFFGCFTSGSGHDVIILPEGTYSLTIAGVDNNNTAGDLDVLDDLTIRGGGMAFSVIDATGLGDRVLNVPDYATSLTLVGIHVTGGSPPMGSGGGIWAEGDLTLVDSLVSGNSAPLYGGGIYATNSGLGSRLLWSTVVDNQAGLDGGGIYSKYLDAANSTIEGNFAGRHGGGIAWTSDSGGHLHRLVNVTVSGNRSGEDGGGLYKDGTGPLELVSTTIVGNEADQDGNDDGNGGGLLIAAGSVRTSHTILAANIDSSVGAFAQVIPDCSGPLQSEGYNLIGVVQGGLCDITGTTIGNQTGTPSVPLDPLLSSLILAGGPTMVHLPHPASPVVDAGDPSGCMHPMGGPLTMDQRGHVRPWDGPDADTDATCDIGAVELDAPDGQLFKDGFETGDTSRWSSS